MITSSARFRDAGAVLVIALFTGLLTLAPPIDRLRGLSIDILTALRWRVFGAMHEPQTSPTVVVALDEETYRTPPFVGTPAITWTPEIGQVLTAVIAGGAKVVGFDIVFPTSIEQSEIPFGDGTLGGRGQIRRTGDRVQDRSRRQSERCAAHWPLGPPASAALA